MLQEYVKKILRTRVYDVAVETPVDRLNFLSKSLENNIFAKREDLQSIFSFKLRGAYNKIVLLSDDEKKQGIIAASAGNHAQGVALAASRLNIKSVIVMPQTTPEIKVRSVKELGSELILHGDNFDEAFAFSQKLCKEEGYTYIHPYDDPDVIAGQGSVAMEILRQFQGNLDAVFIPVGGGGLISGMAVYIKYLHPEIKIIGVEAEDSACLKAALQKGEPVTLSDVGVFADGVAVKKIGEEPFRICKNCVDEVITVSTDEICASVKDIFEDTRTVPEPSGVLALAGMKKYIKEKRVKDKSFVFVQSGANINFDRLRHISERTEFGENKEAIFGVTIPEIPGSFKTFCRAVGTLSITEFNYRFADSEDAQVFVGIKLDPDGNEKKKLTDSFRKLGYSVVDMSDNELAKLHIRYMVGGRSKNLEHEKIYRFEFPERSGALLELLETMGNKWNISMFHYRNHGAAFGRVFIGLQVPESSEKEFEIFLEKINYRYSDENGNPAYTMFLG